MPISHADLAYSLDFRGNLNANIYGVWTSPWFDTLTGGLTAADWLSATFGSTVPSGGSATAEYRSATATDKSDASAWTSDIASLAGRYLQIRIKLNRDDVGTDPTHATSVVPAATSLGKAVLIEEATTNIAQYSEDFTNAWWTKLRCSILSNSLIAPDGTVTADKFVEDTATGEHDCYRSALLTVDAAATFSIYAKAGERSWIRLSFGGTDRVYFDLSTGTIGTKDNASIKAQIIDVGGGWYRCSIAIASINAGNDLAVFGTSTGNGVASYTGDGSSGVYFWGAQAEVKAYPTSYMKTSGGTATRSLEALQVPGNILNVTKGSVVISAYVHNQAAQAMLFATEDASLWNQLTLYVNATQVIAQAKDGAGVTASAAWTTALSVGWHKFGLTYGNGQLHLWVDGEKRASDLTANLPASFNFPLFIGSRSLTSGWWNNLINEFSVFPEVLSDADMDALTA